MLTPHISGTTTAATMRHPRAPITAHTVRGTFPTATLTDEDRELALNNLERDTTVPSTSRVRQSNWRTWLAFHHRWFGTTVPPIPLTTPGIRAVAAQMKDAHYRSFPGYLSAAREIHGAEGHEWTSELERTRKRCVASTQRGIGPPRQCIEIPPQRILDLALDDNSLHDHGPINPTAWAILCSFHMLRGAESASALATSLSIDVATRRETFRLPGSKTDPQAIGCARSWGCVCNNDIRIACPYHAAVSILDGLTQRFGDERGRLPNDLPLFPTTLGEWCSRDGFVTTVAHFADLLTLDTVDSMGRGTIGEHVWRVSGSRMLAHARVPIPTIALMARWGSAVIMRYVELAPLSTITEIVSESVASSSKGPAPSTANVIAEAAQSTFPDATDDSVAEECLVPPLPPPPVSKYALNTTTGVLHVIARRRNWGRTIPGRTCCGRDFLAYDYRLVNSLTATFTKNSAETTNIKCYGCARSTTWTEMENALNDLSESE